jgi:hypothetical protein
LRSSSEIRTITIVDQSFVGPNDNAQLPVILFGNSPAANFTITEGYEPPNGFVKTWNYPQPGVKFPESFEWLTAKMPVL